MNDFLPRGVLLERVEFLRRTVWDVIPPDIRRILKKRTAREKKSARILARQVARAARIPNQPPPLIHNGKAWR